MGILALDQRVLSDVACIRSISVPQLEDLCAMLQLNGPKSTGPTDKKLRRKLSRHASSVGLTPETMERAVMGLSAILTECAKKDISSNDLILSIVDLNLSPEQVAVVVQFYTENKEQIKASVAWNPALGVPEFHSIDWRLDLELGSRTQHHIEKPVLTIQLGTSAAEKQQLQCDYKQLISLTQSLKEALKATQTPHGSRMQRYL
ncbi:hypothetical protein Ae201684P_017017 [Aphanomyces euteiches]|uniref:COMM domain-containing protein n=1 Tax=Aphanomyces euteiches TaxID=100861 RepID=A0A6G0XJD7_9STRA|nr:hypothetical protein Ae201684_004209 [Aphanomyces euteiches]KAH9094409.1 hypothetical protein Ae201684P_017017 [Aphanomyces euteiches]